MNGTEILQNSTTCRCCLSHAPNSIDVLTLVDGISIADTIKEICGIEIYPQDNMPQVICDECLRILKTCRNFRTKTQQTYQTLCNILDGKISVIKEEIEDTNEATPADINNESIIDSSSNLNCPYCSKSFMYRRNLQIHKQRHFMVGKYGCPLCTQRFHTKFDLLRHSATSHLLEKPYQCSECSKPFPTKPELNRHQKLLHDPVKSFSCSKCGMEFKLKANAKQHFYLVHGNERGHVCDVCGKAFAFASRLKAHQSTKCVRPVRMSMITVDECS